MSAPEQGDVVVGNIGVMQGHARDMGLPTATGHQSASSLLRVAVSWSSLSSAVVLALRVVPAPAREIWMNVGGRVIRGDSFRRSGVNGRSGEGYSGLTQKIHETEREGCAIFSRGDNATRWEYAGR